MSTSDTLEGGTTMLMAPELLAPSRCALKGAVPTREGDIYAFGLVMLQVFALHSLSPSTYFFLNNLSGHDWRATISEYQTLGTCIPHLEAAVLDLLHQFLFLFLGRYRVIRVLGDFASLRGLLHCSS